MNLVAEYGDSDDSEGKEAFLQPGIALARAKSAPSADSNLRSVGRSTVLPNVDAAPHVTLLASDRNMSRQGPTHPAQKHIFNNPTVGALHRPLQGPVEAGAPDISLKYRNHKMGHVERLNMSALAFDEQYLSFHNFGHAANPARTVDPGLETLESTEASPQLEQSIWGRGVKRARLTTDKTAIAEDDKWGGFMDQATVMQKCEEQARVQEDEVARQQEEERAVEGHERETKDRVTSVFHGAKETDYCGRSWLENRSQLPKDVDERECYLPKRWIHTWSGHTMGVQAIRWFPVTAHLLLSAGMDATVKIWDVYNQRKCLRTYMGHDQAVRDINFTSDGRRFYSVSHDKNIQQWDTETGQVITTFTNKKTPFCVAVHPDPSQQNVIITGCSNKKAVQWDANKPSIVQEYDEHLGTVNSVTFCEEGKRILTTADDKKIFLWEYGIPVVVKHIAEPSMHSVPSVVMHPNKKYIIGQSMDNKIICYEAFGRFKFMGKRQFRGHINAGYAIMPGFSSDGRWVMSGDTDGKLWFWDWQKMKNYRVLKAHDSVCIGCLWHPVQLSRVASCSWDGSIKLWD